MKKFYIAVLASALGAIGSGAYAQGLSMVSQSLDNPDNIPAPCHPLPTERQIKWNEIEFYAFFHYGMNTYTNLEWGYGNEDVNRFAPTKVPNPRQWLEAVKAAHMKGGIAVVKHHDGFCLWDTQTTDHKCTASSNTNAQQTNIPQAFADAARDLDMKYGFYISPWDRNSALYGTDRYVKEVFMKQCEELARFGSDQFEMWFDGANGGDGYYGGANESRSIDASTYYDVPNLADYVHSIAPDCVMWGVGGEARWIGNESGYAGETNWAMMERGASSEVANRNSGQEEGWIWLPGESDAKATTAGWFWHSNQSDLSAERLFQMYLETVGRNSTLILNIPPDKSGELPASSVSVLKQLGEMLDARLGTDLAKSAKLTASATRQAGAARNYEAANITDGDKTTYWATDDNELQGTLTFEWATPQTVRYVMLQEPIANGQRIRKFHIETSTDGTNWSKVGGSIATTTVGYKRIIPLNGSTSASYGTGYSAKYLRVVIDDSRACPLISNISVY